MTTIIGIEAKNGNRGAILASDLSATKTQWSPEGDVAYRRQTKTEFQKICVNNDRTVALCLAGSVDKQYFSFLKEVLEGRIDIQKVVKTGSFPEFLGLNMDRWEGRIPNQEGNSMLMATRFGDPKLYTCWPLGKVEQRDFTAIGSGSDYALQYLADHRQPLYMGLPIARGIDLAVESLDKAAQDIYTAGLDLVVVTSDRIHEFGRGIKTAVEIARIKKIKQIKGKFS